MNFIDVAIVGGGPAGLTAANTVARQLHTAVVYDDCEYRNKDARELIPHDPDLGPQEPRRLSRPSPQ